MCGKHLASRSQVSTAALPVLGRQVYVTNVPMNITSASYRWPRYNSTLSMIYVLYKHMYVCMYVCIYIYIYVYIYIYTYIYTHVYVHTYMYTCFTHFTYDCIWYSFKGAGPGIHVCAAPPHDTKYDTNHNTHLYNGLLTLIILLIVILTIMITTTTTTTTIIIIIMIIIPALTWPRYPPLRCPFSALAVKIHQRGVQWKQGVVI